MKRPTFPFLATCIALVSVCTVLSTSPASALDERVDVVPDILVLALCQATADTDKYPGDTDTVGGGGQKCCSKELSYCIECVSYPALVAGKDLSYCVKSDYPKKLDRLQKGTLTAPTDRLIAPVDTTPKRPTVKRILKTAPTRLQSN